MIVVEVLARAKGGEGVKSGPIGLAVILLLCIAAYFLFKSMSKHLKRVRDDFPQDVRPDRPRQAAPTPPPAGQPVAPPPARPSTAPPPPERGPTSDPGGAGSP